MSVAVPTTPTHEHLAPSIPPVMAHPRTARTARTAGDTAGTTHGSAVGPPNDPLPTTHTSSASSMSSYSVTPPSRVVVDTLNAPHLGSSHSESEPHFPGAWVDTAPGTPAPLHDNRDKYDEQMKDMNLTERAREVLPPSVVQFLPQSSTGDMAQGPSGLTKSTDPASFPAQRDASREAAGPVNRLAEDPQVEYAEPTSTTKVNSIVSTTSNSRNPSAPIRPVDQATDVQDNSHTLERVMGSTLSPDEDVQEGAKLAGQKIPDSYIVATVPIIATFGKHEHPANAGPQPIQPVSSNVTAQPNPVHPNRESSPQQKVEGLTSREKGASEALSMTQAPSTTVSKSTPSPDRMKSNTSSVLHSAYPHLPPSEGESVDGLSTRAVGGDTSATSLSTSVGKGDSEHGSSRNAVAGIGHAPLPIFSEEHGRALRTQRGRDTALPTGAIAGGATADTVAAKEKEGSRFQHSTSPGNTKSSRFSSTRKLTKSARHSLPVGGGTDDTSALAAGAGFPESTYVIEGGVGAPQDLSKDPLLAPLPVSTSHGEFVEPATAPAFAAGSPKRKHHRLTKKPSPPTDAPLRVSESPPRPPPKDVGTLTGSRADVDTKGTPETGRPHLVNGSASKPKLMDRIKGEVKILQGTIKGDEEKKMEGRMLKEFGSS